MTSQHKQLIAKIIDKIKSINNKIGIVKKDDTLIVDSCAYGDKLPSKGVEGQLFFRIIETNSGSTDTEE